MKRWTNVELDRRFLVEGLINYLKIEGIKYEVSDSSVDGHYYRHFEVFCDEQEQEKIDKMIDWLAFWDTHFKASRR